MAMVCRIGMRGPIVPPEIFPEKSRLHGLGFWILLFCSHATAGRGWDWVGGGAGVARFRGQGRVRASCGGQAMSRC